MSLMGNSSSRFTGPSHMHMGERELRYIHPYNLKRTVRVEGEAESQTEVWAQKQVEVLVEKQVRRRVERRIERQATIRVET